MSGNYSPMGNRSGPFPLVLPSTVSPSRDLSGLGDPEGVVPGVPGQTYTDLNTNNLWMKMLGVLETGWRLVGLANSQGVTGIGQIVPYTGNDPNSAGVFPANRNAPAIAVKPFGTTYTWVIATQNWDV